MELSLIYVINVVVIKLELSSSNYTTPTDMFLVALLAFKRL